MSELINELWNNSLVRSIPDGNGKHFKITHATGRRLTVSEELEILKSNCIPFLLTRTLAPNGTESDYIVVLESDMCLHPDWEFDTVPTFDVVKSNIEANAWFISEQMKLLGVHVFGVHFKDPKELERLNAI